MTSLTQRELELREHHDDAPYQERVRCDMCFLLSQLTETRETIRAYEARVAPGWKPVVDIVGASPQDAKGKT